MSEPTGSWGAALLHFLEEHLAQLDSLVVGYAEMTARSADELVRFLGAELRDDEQHQRELFVALRDSVTASVHGTPNVGHDLPPIRHELTELHWLIGDVERLLVRQQAHLRRLRELQAHIDSRQGTSGLWALIVEMAGLEAQKHIRVLEFLRAAVGSRQYH